MTTTESEKQRDEEGEEGRAGGGRNRRGGCEGGNGEMSHSKQKREQRCGLWFQVLPSRGQKTTGLFLVQGTALVWL